MQSKEEIEEYKQTLYELIDDENVYNSIKEAVRSTFAYIEQLETREQKLIQKLEKDASVRFKILVKNQNGIKVEYMTDTVRQYIEDQLLPILKGENDE